MRKYQSVLIAQQVTKLKGKMVPPHGLEPRTY